jgi:hypothetical protein
MWSRAKAVEDRKHARPGGGADSPAEVDLDLEVPVPILEIEAVARPLAREALRRSSYQAKMRRATRHCSEHAPGGVQVFPDEYERAVARELNDIREPTRTRAPRQPRGKGCHGKPRRKIGHIAQPAMEYLPAGGDTDAEPPWNQHPSAATIAATGGSTNRNRNRDENQCQQHPSHTRHTHTTRRQVHRGLSERHLTERRRHTRRRPGGGHRSPRWSAPDRVGASMTW